MIRILVISLVVANLLLLGFQCSRPSVRPEARATPATVRETGIPTIHLFSEMVQDQGLMSNNRQCFTLGPFHESADRDLVQARLLDVSTRISERETEALVEKGYWVFMPPYATLLEANEKLLSLQALGLKDIAIIYDGEWKNAISLGYFMRRENALRRKQDLEKKGYKPAMRIQREAEPRYWLDYEQSPGSGLLALDMQNRPNDFMQRSVPCPEADFIEANDADSQDPGQDLAQLKAPAEDTGPATGQDKAPEQSGTVAEKAEAPAEPATDQPAVDTVDERVAAPADGETGNAGKQDDKTPAGQVDANVADKTVQTPADQVTEQDAANSVETSPGQAAGDFSGENVETAPKQAVGTGPEHSVPTGPEQAPVNAADQGDVSPSRQEPENTSDTDNDSPPLEDSNNLAGTDLEALPEAAAPEKTGTADPNGTSKDDDSN